MFTVELRVNGALIETVYGHKEGYTGNDDECEYTVIRHVMDSTETEKLTLLHRRSDGLRALAIRALSEESSE